MSKTAYSVNQTAFRILCLLQWLATHPLTFAQINQRFQEHPDIRKTVSQDTLWFYLNTLKALGCEIGRPTPTNGFCYRLYTHPFQFMLHPGDIDVLKDTVRYMEDQLDYWDVMHLYRWLNRVFQQAANPDREALQAEFFHESRAYNLDHLEQLVRVLEAHCQTDQLIQLTYDSPKHGPETMVLLPQKLFHYQGSLYLQGTALDQSESTMLRLERILDLNPLESPALLETLKQRRMEKQVYVFRMLHCRREAYEPLADHDEVIVDPRYEEHLLVKCQSDNPFLLKQKLLTHGVAFQILYPESFRQDMACTLEAMAELYTVMQPYA